MLGSGPFCLDLGYLAEWADRRTDADHLLPLGCYYFFFFFLLQDSFTLSVRPLVGPLVCRSVGAFTNVDFCDFVILENPESNLRFIFPCLSEILSKRSDTRDVV